MIVVRAFIIRLNNCPMSEQRFTVMLSCCSIVNGYLNVSYYVKYCAYDVNVFSI